MKIKMGVSPLSPEQAEKRYWAVSVIRAFGIIQIIGMAILGFIYLRPTLRMTFMGGFGMSYDGALITATILAVVLGLCIGFFSSAMLFAVATFFEDTHTIRGYLRDMHITGQYYDD